MIAPSAPSRGPDMGPHLMHGLWENPKRHVDPFGCFVGLTASGVATGWTGVDMSTLLLLEVAPEIDTNPTPSFYKGVGPVKVRT